MLPLPYLVPAAPRFRTAEERAAALHAAARRAPHCVRIERIGRSEDGRDLLAAVVGTGPHAVSLIAGCHADEPVGPETLTALVEGLANEAYAPLLERVRFCIVPHANLDGEAANRAWIAAWPDAAAYFRDVVREAPGRDVEFGFPDLRAENRAIAAFMAAHAPLALHLSLHGMGVSEGALLLIERHWAGAPTEPLRTAFTAARDAAGLPPHDHDRAGEKGFFRLGPGFATTPEGAMMRRHFHSLGQPEEAARFRKTSMEHARALGGDPLCLVTELPLFRLPRRPEAFTGTPSAYLAFQQARPALRAALQAGEADALRPWQLTPLPLGTAMGLQLAALDAGLRAVGLWPEERDEAREATL